MFRNTERTTLFDLGEWLTLTVTILLACTFYKIISLRARERADALAEANAEAEAVITVMVKADEEKQMLKKLEAKVCSFQQKFKKYSIVKL